jgi:hypothetical protein
VAGEPGSRLASQTVRPRRLSRSSPHQWQPIRPLPPLAGDRPAAKVLAATAELPTLLLDDALEVLALMARVKNAGQGQPTGGRPRGTRHPSADKLACGSGEALSEPAHSTTLDRVTRELTAWNGRKIVVSGLVAWGFLGSLIAWLVLSMVKLADLVTEVANWLIPTLFLLALPSLLTLIAVPMFGRLEQPERSSPPRGSQPDGPDDRNRTA